MLLATQAHQILTPISPGGENEIRMIEHIARVCYKSEGLDDSRNFERSKDFVRRLIKNGHLAMIEHESITVEFVTDRGISHEIVRHRMASYAQESTRWCNYSKQKFGHEIAVIVPSYLSQLEQDDPAFRYWFESCRKAEERYFSLLENGWTPQQARSVLPTCLKTQIVVTANYREWRHIFKLRCALDAHPQMRELMIPLLEELHDKIPVIFDDVYKEVIGN